MKIIVSLLFLLHAYIYACSLCATDVPQVLVDAKISYQKDKTAFDIKWRFHKEFVKSLTQYDTNENNHYEKEEQNLIKESLVTYLEQFHYLTDVEYKHINKLTKQKFIDNIQPIFSKLDFVDDTMIYHYSFDLPFVLSNKNKLYLGFSDKGGNFNFTIKNITLDNYQYVYSLDNKLINIELTLNDPSIKEFTNKDLNATTPTEPLKNIESKSTYLDILSTNLAILKEKLKTTLNDIKNNNTTSSYIWLLLFSFLYGVLHAIGPGHGKSLVSSYFINQEKSYLKAFSISSFIGIVHTFSAFTLTFVVYYSLGFIVNSTITNVEQIATKISATIIIIIALYLIYKKIQSKKESLRFNIKAKPSSILLRNVTHENNLNCGCGACKTTSTDLGVIVAAGIIPCPGTVTIFLFTMSLGIYYVGFLSALFMSSGMSLIIFITAIISVKVRKSTAPNTPILKFFEYASLGFIFSLGLFLLLAS